LQTVISGRVLKNEEDGWELRISYGDEKKTVLTGYRLACHGEQATKFSSQICHLCCRADVGVQRLILLFADHGKQSYNSLEDSTIHKRKRQLDSLNNNVEMSVGFVTWALAQTKLNAYKAMSALVPQEMKYV
jgi:hypothetical protein